MKKSILRELPPILASSTMKRAAMVDEPNIVKRRYWSGFEYEEYHYNNWLYLAAYEEAGILKVSCFLVEQLRTGKKTPRYEIYFSRAEEQYLTYDVRREKWLTGSFWRLDWPIYYYYSGRYKGIWMTQTTRKCICKYFGGHDPVQALSAFQKNIMEKRLAARHKKETDPWDEDLARTPALPKDWEHWVDKVGIQQQYIFYTYASRKWKDGYCTYCEHEVKVQPRHNAKGQCPHCHRPITYKCLGRIKHMETERETVYLMQHCKGGFVIREFFARRIYRRENYQRPSFYISEVRRIMGEESGKLRCAYWYGPYKRQQYRWVKGSVCPLKWMYRQVGMVYEESSPVLSKSVLKETGLYEYMHERKRIDPEMYLVGYSKHPVVEKLSKARLPQMVEDIFVSGYSLEQDVKLNEGQSRLTKLLRLNTPELKRLRQYDGGLKMLAWLQLEHTSGKAISDDTIRWMIGKTVHPHELSFISDRMSVEQIRNYLQRQMLELNITCMEVITYWRDYLAMALRLGMDTNDEIIYRVRKLKQRHDELVLRCQEKSMVLRAAEIIKDFPHVEEIMADIKDMYEYRNEKYSMVVPVRIEDVLIEGRTLNHCVAEHERYWERIENRESYILFLRENSAIDAPYYTVEVEPGGTVRQKRTSLDRQNEDLIDVVAFLTEWQEAIADRVSEEEKHRARRSCELRNENFEQLRRDNVIVNTGTLRGRKLVDVLMEDLMIAA